MIDRKQVKNLREQGWTYERIGKKLGVTKQRIHQLVTGYKPPRDKSYYKKRPKGQSKWAKEKADVYIKKWREEHPEKVKEWIRRYREKNREKLRRKAREYYWKNKEERREYSRRHYWENRERERERKRRWYLENREGVIQKSKQYYQTKLEKAL